MAYETVNTLVSRAAVQLGLGTVSDAIGATDPNVVMLVSFLTTEGRRLSKEREWRQLVKEHTFNTADGTAAYNLPTDFLRMVDSTAWNRDTDWQCTPIGPQTWQYLKTGAVSSTLSVLFRLRLATLEIIPTPSAVDTIAFDYLSTYWLAATASPTVLAKDAPTVNTDVVLLDSELMTAALKLEWKKAKGMDATAALAEYQNAEALAARNAKGAAPVLNTLGPVGDGLLDERNLPDSGYGQ